MRIIIKGRQFKVDNNLQVYIEEKILKYQKFVIEPAVCEVVLADMGGKKGGKDKEVRLTLTLPQEKKPLYFCARTADFIGSIDLVQEKLEKFLLKYKETKKIGSQFPTKYYQAKKEEERAGEI